MPLDINPLKAPDLRPRAEGKFLFIGDEKFFVRGATYGAFPPNSQGHQFPEPPEVERDFALMRQAGINTILTYTVPPRSMLDQALAHGLRVVVNIPWMQYTCFLESQSTRRDIRLEVEAAVRACRGHPAVLMHAVAKELPPQIVQWHGPRKIERFLSELYDAAKSEDPESLVTYTNYPTTEYLELPFVDVFTFNVYLHERPEYAAYLSRLQHLSGEKPFVLTELGMCSFRHGEQGQAAFIDWQLEEAFDQGCAGAIIFGWTDPFFQDGCLIDEWGFGLVDAERQPKPSYSVVQKKFTTGVPFVSDRPWPKVSVVVAMYNAASTLDDCLSSLTKLKYPNYEVIVVNDGSTDDSEAIAKKYPFNLISKPNGGVSDARNAGLRAATGEIVAYIDSDARADPDWLSYLTIPYIKSDVIGVGGPNLVPPEDEWIAQCVYRSPGGPTQVMFDDVSAEHIPGCNMSFRKSALEEIGFFDPIFTAAGDDVDICWRLLAKGYRIGFSPSAVVWHHRRPSVRAYWKQQVGYGKSEALLERVHPNKFNPWGHTFWAGRIYAPYPFFRLVGEPVIYRGLWGSAGFQPMYEPGGGSILNFLPRAMEFHVALVGLAVLGIFWAWAFISVAAGIAYILLYCVNCGLRADLSSVVNASPNFDWKERLRWRAMLALLHFMEPLARDWGRLKGGLTPWRSAVLGDDARHVSTFSLANFQPFRRTVKWSYRGGMALEKYSLLNQIMEKLGWRSSAVGWNPSTEDWDLRTRRGALAEARVHVAIEHHGGPKRTAQIRSEIRSVKSLSCTYLVLALLIGLTASLGATLAPIFLALLFVVLWIAPILEANRLQRLLEVVTKEAVRDLSTEDDDAAQDAA
jgi:GT2 family glycosyltransferase